MPLNDQFPKAVAFVVGWRKDPTGSLVQTAIGTAFFVAVPNTSGDAGWICAVTARHVIEMETQTWLRVRAKDGSIQLITTTPWVQHPSADVAVAHMPSPDTLDIKWLTMTDFLDLSPTMPALGDPVYFIGLLAMAGSMVAENVPMVRSGTLGRMYQEGVPLQRGDGTISHHVVHLIDCRSFGGFSGSPCFAEFRVPPRPGLAGVFIGGLSALPETKCIGLISGHFDDLAKVRAIEELADDPVVKAIRFPVNTGVGIVTPIEKVRECLMDGSLVAMRQLAEAMAAAQTETEPTVKEADQEEPAGA